LIKADVLISVFKIIKKSQINHQNKNKSPNDVLISAAFTFSHDFNEEKLNNLSVKILNQILR
ncbi:MAG TPA: hypothetical protein PK073_06170, partial [Ignavibacteriaceae bacterium]|nr:hypothetical protein [Ignavibacteriaceae bacterium]